MHQARFAPFDSIPAIRPILLRLVLALLLSHSLLAQGETEPVMLEGFWRANLGVGGSTLGIAVGASAQYELAGHLLTLEGTLNQGLDIISPRQPESLWEIGLLYGRSWRTPYIFSAASVGLAYVGGRKRAEPPPAGYQGGPLEERYTDHDIATVGIPVQGELLVQPLSWLGIGATALVNLNLERPTFGGMLTLSLGRLR